MPRLRDGKNKRNRKPDEIRGEKSQNSKVKSQNRVITGQDGIQAGWLEEAEQAFLFKTHENAVLFHLYRPGFEVVAFAADVAAVLQAEFVAVQGANNISQGIQ